MFHDKYSMLYSCLLPVKTNESCFFFCRQFSHTPAFVSHGNRYQVHCKFHCRAKWSVECCNCSCFFLIFIFFYIYLPRTDWKPHLPFFLFFFCCLKDILYMETVLLFNTGTFTWFIVSQEQRHVTREYIAARLYKGGAVLEVFVWVWMNYIGLCGLWNTLHILVKKKS